MDAVAIANFNSGMRMIGSKAEIITSERTGKHVLYLEGNCGDTLRVPDGVDSICCKKDPVVVTNMCKEIEPVSFSRIHIPDSVKELQYCAFWGNDKLIEVSGGNEIVDIGDMAFKGCASLKHLKLSKARAVGYAGFEGCESLEHLDLPVVEVFMQRALKWCYKLNTLNSKPREFSEDNLNDINELECLDLRNCAVWNNGKVENAMYLHDIIKYANCREVIMPSIPYIEFNLDRVLHKGGYRRVTFTFEKAESIGVSNSCGETYIKLLNTCDVYVMQPKGVGGATCRMTFNAGVEYSIKSLVYGAKL